MIVPEKQVKNFFLEKQRIRKYFYVGTIFSVLILVSALSFNYIRSLDSEYSKKIRQLSTSIINAKKNLMRSSIEQAIYFIEAQKTLFMVHLQESGQIYEQDEKDQLFKEYIRPVIRDLRMGNNGYIWINEIHNYNGGDDYAIRFVHPNMPETEGSSLSTNTVDIKGNKPYKMELEGIKNSGELFFDYYFKVMDSDELAHKMSYAKLYEPYNWVVATGVYLNDVDELIKVEEEMMQQTHNRQLLISFGLAGLTLLIVGVILIFVEKQIIKFLTAYENSITEYTEKILLEKDHTEKALKQVKELKGLLPICSQCKKIREDSGYWSQIEEYIQVHSDASFSHSMCPDCMQDFYGKEDWFNNADSDPSSDSNK